jgi:hypothetical protein
MKEHSDNPEQRDSHTWLVWSGALGLALAGIMVLRGDPGSARWFATTGGAAPCPRSAVPPRHLGADAAVEPEHGSVGASDADPVGRRGHGDPRPSVTGVRLTSITDPLSRTSRRFVDGAGRVTAISDGLGYRTTFSFDVPR